MAIFLPEPGQLFKHPIPVLLQDRASMAMPAPRSVRAKPDRAREANLVQPAYAIGTQQTSASCAALVPNPMSESRVFEPTIRHVAIAKALLVRNQLLQSFVPSVRS